jgi:hypothetical protein
MNAPIPPPFVRRFEQLRARLRRTDSAARIGWILVLLILALGAVAAIDFAYEWPWWPRMILSVVAVGLSVAALLYSIVGAFLRWRRSNTAVEMESAFPELGQAVRTSVQFGTQKTPEYGVAPRLVEALHATTERRAEPLGLETMLPLPQLIGAIAIACILSGIGAGAVLSNPEWRLALSRVLGGDRPYTETTVSPGDTRVDEGEPLQIAVALAGRTGRDVVLRTRQLDGEWTEATMAASKAAVATDKNAVATASFEAKIGSVKKPMEYQVVVGKVESPIFRANVRYPLKIKAVEGEVVPPAYTRQPPAVQTGGDFDVLEGSKVQVTIELDQAIASGNVAVMTAIPSQAKPKVDQAVATAEAPAPETQAATDATTSDGVGPTAAASPESVATTEGEKPAAKEESVTPELEPAQDAAPELVASAEVIGSSIRFTVEPGESIIYKVTAEGVDGAALKETSFRIRVRKDQPPQISFDQPDDKSESHALAEVMMKARARDDYGLARSGIIFQVNNQEEYPLVSEDFEEALKALETVEAEGGLSPTTQAILEKMLPLEHFKLSHTDSVMYYAFAEDNRPGTPQRSETDMRFIDIRPFKRTFRVQEPMDGGDGMPGRRLMALEEMIHRERVALNRTLSLMRRGARGQATDLNTVDSLVQYQTETAEGARGFAAFLQSRGFDRTELLAEAEGAIMSSVDSLSAGSFDTAQLQMRDALKYLIEMRDLLEIVISNGDASQLRDLQNFDRALIQKLRYPKADRKKLARQVVQRAEMLAQRQRQVAQGAAQAMRPSDQGEGVGSGKPKDPMENEPGSPDKPMPDPTEEKPEEATGDEKPEEKKDEGKTEEMAPEEKPGPDFRELEDKQNDIAIDAGAIASVVNDLEGATDQAKERASQAATQTQSVADMLQTNKTDSANAANKAADQLDELAKNLKGLLSPDIADRIAAARDLAGELARREEKVADAAAKQMDGGGEGKDEKDPTKKGGSGKQEDQKAENEKTRAALEGETQRLADAASTLKDILDAASKLTDPADAKAAKELARIGKESKLEETAAKAKLVAPLVRNERYDDVRVEAAAAADQFQNAAQQLDSLYRALVAPKIEELTKLEGELAAAAEKMNEWKSAGDIEQWHADVEGILEKMDEMRLGGEAMDEFQNERGKAGLTDRNEKGISGLSRTKGGVYSAPATYKAWMSANLNRVQQMIQELILAEMAAEGREAAPPQYEAMIERYYEILSATATSK